MTMTQTQLQALADQLAADPVKHAAKNARLLDALQGGNEVRRLRASCWNARRRLAPLAPPPPPAARRRPPPRAAGRGRGRAGSGGTTRRVVPRRPHPDAPAHPHLSQAAARAAVQALKVYFVTAWNDGALAPKRQRTDAGPPQAGQPQRQQDAQAQGQGQEPEQQLREPAQDGGGEARPGGMPGAQQQQQQEPRGAGAAASGERADAAAADGADPAAAANGAGAAGRDLYGAYVSRLLRALAGPAPPGLQVSAAASLLELARHEAGPGAISARLVEAVVSALARGASPAPEAASLFFSRHLPCLDVRYHALRAAARAARCVGGGGGGGGEGGGADGGGGGAGEGGGEEGGGGGGFAAPADAARALFDLLSHAAPVRPGDDLSAARSWCGAAEVRRRGRPGRRGLGTGGPEAGAARRPAGARAAACAAAGTAARRLGPGWAASSPRCGAAPLDTPLQAGLVAAAADASASSKARRKRKAAAAAAAADGSAGAGAAAAAPAAAWANPKAQQRAYQEAWLAFLRLDLPADIYRKARR
jgi:hypothetical protein